MKVMVLNCFQCGGNCLTVGNPITNRRFHSSKESGIALIITLALIVLVTVTAVAFFTRATSNRSVEASRANQILARLLAESGSDYTVSNFIMEIVTNSTVNPTLPGTYIPTNDFVPVQLLSSNIPTNLWSNSFANLVRQSAPPGAGQAAGSTLPFETNASSNDSTAIPSENGRLVDTNRWSAPQLIAGGFTSTNQLPNWIYINRDGTLTGTISSANASNIIGRFAYNAYNIGGLLDANVAGYPPDAITPGDTNMPVLKGTLAGADLTQLPGITPADVASFINWRNSNAASSAQTYVADVTNAAATGFLNASNTNGDQSFSSRQDLIRYATLQNPDFTNSLPYLTHFTRELAVPSLTNVVTVYTNRFALTNLSIKSVTNIYGICSNAGYYPPNYAFLRPVGDLVNPNFPVLDRSSRAMEVALNIIDQFNNGITMNPDTNTMDIPVGSGNNISFVGKKALPFIDRLYVACNISPDPNNPGGFVCNASVVPELWIPPGGSSNCMIIPVFAPSNPPTVTVIATPVLGGNSPPPSVLTLQASTAATITPNLSPDGTSSQGWSEYLAFAQAPGAPYASSGFFAALPGTIPSPPPPPTSGSPAGTSNSYTFTIAVAINGLSFLLSTEDGTVNYESFGLDPNTPPMASAQLIINTTLGGGSATGFQANSDMNHIYGLAVFAEDPRTIQNAGTEFDFPGELDLSSATFGNDVVAAGLPDPVPPSVPYPNPITDTNYTLPTNHINSVGELGYVFTGGPWRTIDFVSGIPTAGGLNPNWTNTVYPWSEYWQLLDLFSAYAAPTNAMGFPVRAGVLNLNTRQTNVLAAVLSGTTTIPGSWISPGDATNVANTMLAMTTNPWTTRAQLVDLVYEISTNPPTSIGSDKRGLESIVRALGEVGQVRTWNLLIDVVAQSGRFPANLQNPAAGKTSMGSQFIVGGEDRIWTSVAIDRFTGQVIDRKTEQVMQ